MPLLDIRTLSFLALITSLLLALGLQLVNRTIAKDPCLRLWTVGASVSGAAYVLFALRGVVPDLISIVAANTLLTVGGAWYYLGNRRFRELAPEFPWYWALAAVMAVLLYYFTYPVPSLKARIVIMSAALAALGFASALVLLRPGDHRDRMVRWCLATGFLATAIFMAARGILTAAGASTEQDFMVVANPIHALAFVFGIGLTVVLGIGLPLLVSGRLQRQLVESEVQLQGILESTADGVLAVDRSGMVFRANRLFARLWRIPPSLMGSKDDQALLQHVLAQLRDPDAFLAKVHALYESDDQSTDILHFHDGRVFERYSSPLILHRSTLGRVWSFRDITERTRTEEALHASEERFRSLTELGSDWYWEQDQHFRFKEMSGGLGYRANITPAEHIGKTRWELQYSDMDDSVWQRHREQIQRHEPFRDFEIRRLDDAGNLCVVSISGEPVYDAAGTFSGYRGVGRDVTRRKLAEETLRANEERSRDLAAMSSDWLWEQDDRFCFTAMSEEWSRKARFSLGSTIGRTRWELPIVGVSDAQWRAHRALLERHEGFENFVYRLRNDDGDLRWFSITGKPVFGQDGRFRGYRGTGRDISEQVNLERKSRQAQKMEAVGRLAGGFAHVFNNILAAIVGNERLARADLASDDPVQESLREIDKGARRAQDLIRQLLTFSQPQDTQPQALDAAAVVGDALRLLRATLPAMIEIRADYAPRLPAILATAPAISQVIMSLGGNAADAIEDGGMFEIKVSEALAQQLPAELVPSLHGRSYVCIAVHDTGRGMDQQTRERIFDPFFTTKTIGQGAGLGLSVVRGIVRDLDGAIAVASEPGEGTTFFVYLPACLPNADTAGVASEGVRGPIAANAGEPVRILLIDDEEALVFLSKRTLERMGYRVDGYTDPREALGVFERAPQTFDVVITDLAMPHLSGMDLAERMLAIRPGTPVMVISGHIRETDKLRAHALGIRDLYWKPNTVEDLAQILHARISAPDQGH